MQKVALPSQKILLSAAWRLAPVLLSLFIGGCAQIAHESMPVQLGGTGHILLYEKETQGPACALGARVQYVKYPMGLGSTPGEKLVVRVVNDSTHTYSADIGLAGTDEDTGVVVKKAIATGVLLLPKADGPPYGRLGGDRFAYVHESDLKLPVADWRKYKWSVEVANCAAVTVKDDPRLAQPRLLAPGICTSQKPCILMSFNLPKSVLEDAGANARQNRDGSISLRLPVKGRRPDAITNPESNHLLLRVAPNVHCPASVGGVLPVLGFNPEGHALIATGSGEFLLTDSRFALGCKACLDVIDPKGGAVVGRADAPGWNLPKLGYSLAGIGYDDPGTLYVRHEFRDNTSVCVKLNKNGRFEWGGRGACAPSKYQMRLITETCP